jgi:vitamin B12 transporter
VSTLYGSDAMTSALTFTTRAGSTRTPELRFGAEGGNFGTARGFASVSGARGPLDFNLFGQQFNTEGQGVNDDYSNSSQGANIGLRLSSRASFRFHLRHSNERSGVQSFWNFNGQPLITPDTDQRARQNNLLASASFTIAAPSKWQHRFTGLEYHHRRLNADTFQDPGRESPAFGNFDFPFTDFANINRAGLEYQGEYWATDWTRSTFGYRFEDENGFAGDVTAPPLSHGLRRNHEVFGEQILNWKRFSVVAGARFVHNESFGNRGIPRIGASFAVARGGEIFSGTRLRFSYGTGIKEPRLEESFGTGGFGIIPNPNLKAESNRSLEAGIQQSLFSGKMSLAGTYYNNLFSDQIAFNFDPTTFIGQYVNVNKAFAHGAELEWHAQPTSRIAMEATYVYTAGQILRTPLCEPFCDPLLARGAPLLRRPKHSATTLVTYTRPKFGAQLGGTFVGPRPDSDFLGLVPPVTHAAGYGRIDVGGWRALNSRLTAYLNVENLLNRHYEEVAGYPGLRLNFRAGMRFRIGGD